MRISKFWQKNIVLPGVGGSIAIMLLILLGELMPTLPTLIPAFGATIFLLFVVPNSPFSQFKNVIGSYVIAAIVSLIIVSILGYNIFYIALATGLSMILIQASDTHHPPSNAIPIFLVSTHQHWAVLESIIVGLTMLCILAHFFNKFTQGDTNGQNNK